MAKSTFTISSLIVLTGAVAVFLAGYIWWNRPPPPQYWQSGIGDTDAIETAEVMRYLDDGWTDWLPLSKTDAKSLIDISEKCPIYFAPSNGPGASFPPPSTAIRVTTAQHKKIEIEMRGSGFSMTTSDHTTLIADGYRDKIVELVDPNSEVYERR